MRSKNIPVQWEEKEDTEDQPDQDFIARGDSAPPNETDTASGDDDEFTPKDFWILTRDLLIRYHNVPRDKLFVPDAADCPIPLKYLDVMRVTETDLDTKAERRIPDIWTDNTDGNPSRDLSSPWVGRTMFDILRPRPPPGMKWVEGRLTRVQSTTRPDNVWPESWELMSRKMQKMQSVFFGGNRKSSQTKIARKAWSA